MSNHSSFMKMIGMESDDIVTESHETSETVEASQVVEVSNSQTESATEWDAGSTVEAPQESNEFLEQAESFEEALEAVAAEPTEEVAYEVSSTELAEENFKTEISSEILEDRLTKTEVLDHQGLFDESTGLYSKDESIAVEGGGSELSELARAAGGGTEVRTRQTVPFDYESDDRSKKSSSRTAHFDYDASVKDEKALSRLVVLEGPVSAKAFYLGSLPLRVGRDPLNEVVIDDANVSRYHAEVRDEGGQLVIVDLGSTNGVKVNGQVVQQHALQSNDVVQMGDALFEFLGAGILSRGVPKAAVIEAVSDSEKSLVSKTKSKKRRNLILAVVILLGLGYFWSAYQNQIAEQAVTSSRKILSNKMESEIADLKTSLERQSKKTLDQVPADEVKKALIEKIEASKLASLLPNEVKARVQAVPSEVIKLMVEDPKLLPTVMTGGGTLEAFSTVARARLTTLVEKGRFEEAIRIIDFLIQANPKDETIKRWREQLKTRVDSQAQSVVTSDAEDEKVLQLYDQTFNGLLERGRVKDALKFAKTVRANALEAITQFPNYADRARAEADKWATRIADTEALLGRVNQQQEMSDAKEAEGDRLIADINNELDFANVQEARKHMDEFLKKYSKHPRVSEVLRLKKQLEDQLNGAFATSKMNIETLMKAESYESAWNEVYRYLDQMPESAQALELKSNLEKVTAARATQFYNQARVFEFEADDLVAAEQYYKKALEVADPRGELFKKAQRRFGEVKRKSIQ